MTTASLFSTVSCRIKLHSSIYNYYYGVTSFVRYGPNIFDGVLHLEQIPN